MPTIARRLFIPDAPAGTVGQVLGIQSDGTAGWITSGAGAGEPYTVVDTLAANPRTVTDWGPILNSAIAAGDTTFLYGPYIYPFSTTILFNGGANTGITFEGAGVWNTYLRWTGTGAGTAFDLTGHQQPEFHRFSVDYTQHTFTGSLFKLFNSFNATYHKVRFGHDLGDEPASHIGTAYCAIDAANMNTLILRDCELASDFTAAGISGAKTGASFCNVLRCDDTTFHGKAIIDPALDFLLNHCILEVTDLAANEAAIYNANTSYHYSLTLRDCCYWDVGANAATNRIVDLTAGAVGKFEAHSCYDETGNKPLAGLYRILSGSGGIGNSSVAISGGYTSNDIDVGTAASSQRKVAISVTGLDFQSGSALLHHQTGHDNLLVAGTSGLDFFSGDGDIPLGHERNTRVSANGPTAAAHAGVVNLTVGVDSRSTDGSGIITLNNTGGVTSATGLLADVTFGTPPSPTPTANNYFPYVVVGPSGLTGFWNAAAAAACQPWAQVTANDFGHFSIGVNVGIPAGQTVAITYRVAWTT